MLWHSNEKLNLFLHKLILFNTKLAKTDFQANIIIIHQQEHETKAIVCKIMVLYKNSLLTISEWVCGSGVFSELGSFFSLSYKRVSSSSLLGWCLSSGLSCMYTLL